MFYPDAIQEGCSGDKERTELLPAPPTPSLLLLQATALFPTTQLTQINNSKASCSKHRAWGQRQARRQLAPCFIKLLPREGRARAAGAARHPLCRTDAHCYLRRCCSEEETKVSH